jgi:peptidoglycan-N-acetylglucosamine deacetylase
MTGVGLNRAGVAAGIGLAGIAVAGAAVHVAPAVAAVGPLRRALFPGLAGTGQPGHVALTFDDGPDPESTPFFLDMLATHGVRATFFVVGERLARYPALGREIAAAGHELAVHGWVHKCHLRFGPATVERHLARTSGLIEELTGTRPSWFRPPFGVLSAAVLGATRRVGLRPVLWSCWGRDWTATATPDSVHALVTRGLRGGGTVLLHDTASPTAAAGSWKSTLDAAPRIIQHCRERGWSVGPLREHGLR